MNQRTENIIAYIDNQLRGTSLNEYTEVVGFVGSHLQNKFFSEFRKYDAVRKERMEMLESQISALKAENDQLKSEAGKMRCWQPSVTFWYNMYNEAKAKNDRYKRVVKTMQDTAQNQRTKIKNLQEEIRKCK